MSRYEEATMEQMQSAYQPENEADKRLMVLFSFHPHPNAERTAKEARPIFDDREYVMIMVPGDKESIVHRPVMERDKQRFPRQYQAFLNKQNQQSASGTPLKLVPFLTGGQIKELEFFNCYTVEQLGALPDAHMHRFQNGQQMKKLANDFLEAARGLAPITRLESELASRDNQIEVLNRNLQELSKQVESMRKDAAEAEA